MYSPCRWTLCLMCLSAACVPVRAQVSAAAGIAPAHVSQSVQTVPRVPGLSTIFDGFNGGVTSSAVHSSSVGWYSMLTPAVNYTFSRHFSADANASIYFNRQYQNTNPATKTSKPMVSDGVDPGDTLLGFHAIFEPGALQNATTVSLTAPTGDSAKGFGAGEVTYDFSNNTVRYYKKVGFLVDVGTGNSSGLFNNLVSKDYTTVGWLAHFQGGAVVWLPHHSYIQSVAYEQLPLGSQTVYRSAQGGKDKRGYHFGGPDDPNPEPPPVETVASDSEDNGFTTFAGIPLNNNFSLCGYYNRSLRQHLDTMSFGMTYVLRGRSKSRSESMIDRALREAEAGKP